MESILNVHRILISPKHYLKRCRRCNFKKRICVLDPESCKAAQCFCFMCNKFGHFPKSIYCKGRNKSKKKNVSKKACQINHPQSKQWKKDVYLLVMKRINQVERSLEMQEISRIDDRKVKSVEYYGMAFINCSKKFGIESAFIKTSLFLFQ